MISLQEYPCLQGNTEKISTDMSCVEEKYMQPKTQKSKNPNVT